jgi:hypothetical protein
MDEAKAPLPLAGLRVVEFTHMVMGPTCGMMLADMGAEAIKVEPVDGDPTRRLLGAGAASSDVQPQEEHPDRPAFACRRRGAQSRQERRRRDRELQAGDDGQARAGLRGTGERAESARHLCQSQGLPCRART